MGRFQIVPIVPSATGNVAPVEKVFIVNPFVLLIVGFRMEVVKSKGAKMEPLLIRVVIKHVPSRSMVRERFVEVLISVFEDLHLADL